VGPGCREIGFECGGLGGAGAAVDGSIRVLRPSVGQPLSVSPDLTWPVLSYAEGGLGFFFAAVPKKESLSPG
jgi:hypothetical protein